MLRQRNSSVSRRYHGVIILCEGPVLLPRRTVSQAKHQNPLSKPCKASVLALRGRLIDVLTCWRTRKSRKISV